MASGSTADRSARRRAAAREMRAMLEGFVARNPFEIDLGVDRATHRARCRYCARSWPVEALQPSPGLAPADLHADDCLWRYARAWLQTHRRPG